MRMRKSGFSLVELLIAITVIGIMAAAVVFAGGPDKARRVTAIKSIDALYQAGKGYIEPGQLTYAGISVDALKTAGLLPNNFAPTASNPWGGDYSVAVDGSDSTRFVVTLTEVPDAATATKLSNAIGPKAYADPTYNDATQNWSVTFK